MYGIKSDSDHKETVLKAGIKSGTSHCTDSHQAYGKEFWKCGKSNDFAQICKIRKKTQGRNMFPWLEWWKCIFPPLVKWISVPGNEGYMGFPITDHNKLNF